MSTIADTTPSAPPATPEERSQTVGLAPETHRLYDAWIAAGDETAAQLAELARALPTDLRAHRRALKALEQALTREDRARRAYQTAWDRDPAQTICGVRINELAARLRAIETRALRRRPVRLTEEERLCVADARRTVRLALQRLGDL